MSELLIQFDRNVERWIHYSESVKGRLRLELTWRHLKLHLKTVGSLTRVLDAGCGLGETASLLLDRAENLVLLDSSENMLDEAKKRLSGKVPATDLGRLSFINGRVEVLEYCLPGGSFDLILCHNIVEYVKDPQAVLASLAARLAPGGLLSLVAANRFNEPLKLAVANLKLDEARQALDENCFTADLFDSAPKRAFSLEELEEMAGGLKLNILGTYGIRTFADFLPEPMMQKPEIYGQLLELEKQAADRFPYLLTARYFQLVCRK